MILGRVVGTLVANRKDSGLLGQKLLLVRNVTLEAALNVILGPHDLEFYVDAAGAHVRAKP